MCHRVIELANIGKRFLTFGEKHEFLSENLYRKFLPRDLGGEPIQNSRQLALPHFGAMAAVLINDLVNH